MADWIKAMNPTSPITTEAEAEAAARASAISIFIGVIVGAISLAWTLANPAAMQEAATAAAAGGDANAEAAAAMGAQAGLWLAGGLTVVQLIFGIVQWRNPGKFIAILFMVLIAFGLASTLATPMMASMAPGMPVIPTWQIVLSVVVMIVQLVLHIAGLRGIGQRDKLQMAAAR